MATDDVRDNLFLCIGECLHAWSWVELETVNLYMVLNSISRQNLTHPSRAAFEAVISLEVRLAIIGAYVAADSPIRDDYLSHYKSLSSRIFKLYKKRHEVAHFMVVRRDTKTGLQVAIQPFFSASTYAQKNGTELSVSQIAERLELFKKLHTRLRHHVQHVGSLRKLPLEYYVLDGDIAFPPLRRGDLSPEESLPPPAPSPP